MVYMKKVSVSYLWVVVNNCLDEMWKQTCFET